MLDSFNPQGILYYVTIQGGRGSIPTFATNIKIKNKKYNLSVYTKPIP
jgi:hypothetical protein